MATLIRVHAKCVRSFTFSKNRFEFLGYFRWLLHLPLECVLLCFRKELSCERTHDSMRDIAFVRQ